MHAASVHPEPGSNSLKIVYNVPKHFISLFRAFVALLLRVSKIQKNFRSLSTFDCLLFSFQRAFRLRFPLVESLFIIPRSRLFVKRFLKLFSNFFLTLRFVIGFEGLLFGKLDYYTIFQPLCQYLFAKFLRFFALAVSVPHSLPSLHRTRSHILSFIYHLPAFPSALHFLLTFPQVCGIIYVEYLFNI